MPPSFTVITRENAQRTVAGREGLSVMELIRESGVDELMALCGGCCSCATCHVYVAPAFADRLPEMQPEEDALLDGSSHRRPESRLACQLPFSESLADLVVTLAPED